MVALDKIKIFNSFLTVVQLIKSVRKDLIGELDAVKANSSVIDDEAESTKSVWSSSKVKQYVTNAINTVVGGADENSDTLAELAEALKAKAASTEGLLNVNAKQELTEAQKLMALENLGITKEFLVKLLVDDADVSDATLWSARKVSESIKEATDNLLVDSLTTDEELEAALANIADLPAPQKAGQVLAVVAEGDALVTKWVDYPVASDKPTETTTPAEDNTSGGEGTQEGGATEDKTEETPVDNQGTTPAEDSETTGTNTDGATTSQEGNGETTGNPAESTDAQPSGSADQAGETQGDVGSTQTEDVPATGEQSEGSASDGQTGETSSGTSDTTDPSTSEGQDSVPETPSAPTEPAPAPPAGDNTEEPKIVID